MPDTQNTFYKYYVFPLSYSFGSFAVFHPLDYFKVKQQINLGTASKNNLHLFMHSGIKEVYKGFCAGAWRLLSRTTYLSPLMMHMPKAIDSYNLGIPLSILIKASIVSTLDSYLGSPFENIKTMQMNEQNTMSMRSMTKQIYSQHGARGFFFGTHATIAKAFPTWLYFFIGYQLVKDKKQKENFYSLLLHAAQVAAPLALATAPLDLIKTHKQANLVSENDSMLKALKKIIEKHGATALGRGAVVRFLQKIMSTTLGYVMLDKAENQESDSICNRKM